MNKYINMFRKNVFLVIVIFLCVFLGYSLYSYFLKDYILKINKTYVYENEFLLYYNEQKRVFEEIGGVDIWKTDFDGMPAKEIAKNNTISSIIIVKIANSKAKELGVTLSDDEVKYFKSEAKILKEKIEKLYNKKFPIKLCENFIKENLIEGKVYNNITGSFIVDEKDFSKYLEQYKEKNEKSLYKINLDYIFVKNNTKFDAKVKAEEIIKNVTLKTNFEDYKMENIEVKTNFNLQNSSFEANVQDKVYNLTEKSVSNLIESRDGFYIFKINSKYPLSEENIKEESKSEYISLKKEEIYKNQIEIWISNAKIKKNNKILTNI